MSLGAEFGVDSSSFTMPGYTDTVLAIPLLLRAAYHFDLHPKVDLYLVGKIGWVFGAWSGDEYDWYKKNGVTMDPDPLMGMGFGADLGGAYYFTPRFGLFAEGGFDAYMLQTKFTIPAGGYRQEGTATLNASFYRFITIGFSTKF
jgi:hypothetical protein